MIIRLTASSLLAAFLSVAVFFLMQALIFVVVEPPEEQLVTRWVDFVRVKPSEPPFLPEKRRQKPPEIGPPPVTKQPIFKRGEPTSGDPFIAEPTIPRQRLTGPVIADGSLMTLVKVQPAYPRRALREGLSGWVIIEFDVGTDGSVRNPHVVSNCAAVVSVAGDCVDRPNSIFDASALKAAMKFRYRPRVETGIAYQPTGVRNRLTFSLQ